MKNILVTFISLAIFSIIFGGEGKAWDYPLDVDLTEVKFYHGGSGTALNIKVNNDTDMAVPEYEDGVAVGRFAYIKSTVPVVKARLYSLSWDPEEDLTIRAVAQNVNPGDGFYPFTGWSLGNTSVSFPGGPDTEGTFNCAPGTAAPDSLGKWKTKFSWQVVAVGGTSYFQYLGETTHDYYTVLSTPQSPMLEPWTEVLDHACKWAYGASTEEQVVRGISVGSYNDNWFYYASNRPHCQEDNGQYYFDLTGLFFDERGDCQDASAVVQVFSNALGVGQNNIKNMRVNGTFNTQAIDPIGTEEGWVYKSWSFHQFAWYNSKIYDSCIRLNESDPRIPVNEVLDAYGSYYSDLYYSGTWDFWSWTPHRYTGVY